MKHMKHKRSVGAVLVLAIFLQACQPSTLISSLEAVVTAAEIAIPVIGAAAGLPPATVAGIVTYLQLVDQATVQASNILAGPGTSAQKAAQILAAFASIASGCNCIPAGTPAVVVAVVEAVIQAVAKFLGNFNPKALTAADQPTIKISGRDRAALAKIRTRAEQNLSKLQGLKK